MFTHIPSRKNTLGDKIETDLDNNNNKTSGVDQDNQPFSQYFLSLSVWIIEGEIPVPNHLAIKCFFFFQTT
ncbi:unnamed protein product [Trichobilharzia szidati]|nr:unnamed protein product [Trichobilharzia szidati]